MDRLLIAGGKPLVGHIPVSGAKNAALPIMIAALLTNKPLCLHNVPNLADIRSAVALLQQLGVCTTHDERENTCTLHAETITTDTALYDVVRKMRASILVLGPLLARTGHARVSLPGGCAIGARPVDIHLDVMRQLGAEIVLENGYIEAYAPANGLQGAHIIFPVVSVGATENALMAACLAEGVTMLSNAAKEPEITDLAECLVAMGAHIEGIGTATLAIHGKASLNSAVHTIIPDRIEAGTYMMAGAITGGDITVDGVNPTHLESVIHVLRAADVTVKKIDEKTLNITASCDTLCGVDMTTKPYPGFPTDLQAQFMALMSIANGASMITENIFENRFMHVPELCRMGANINTQGHGAIVRGVPFLIGAPVMATDLRASVSLVLAALAAKGESIINRIYHLDRGYDRLSEKLTACGGHIERIE